MNITVEQSGLLQSGIDCLKGWALCQFSLVVSVLSPLCLSSLPPAGVGACRPKCFNRNVLITGVVRHVVGECVSLLHVCNTQWYCMKRWLVV